MATNQLGCTAIPTSSIGDSNQTHTILTVGIADSLIAPESGTCTKMFVHINDAGAGTNTVTLGLYEDNAGTPGNILGQGSLTTTFSVGWNEIAISSVSIVSGNIYYPFIQAASGDGRISITNTTGYAGNRNLGASIPDPYSAQLSTAYANNIYAEYEGAGGQEVILEPVINESEVITTALLSGKSILATINESESITASLLTSKIITAIVNESEEITASLLSGKSISAIINESETITATLLTESTINEVVLTPVVNESEQITALLLTAKELNPVVNESEVITATLKNRLPLNPVVNETEVITVNLQVGVKEFLKIISTKGNAIGSINTLSDTISFINTKSDTLATIQTKGEA